jgi:hypothetical protein
MRHLSSAMAFYSSYKKPPFRWGLAEIRRFVDQI